MSNTIALIADDASKENLINFVLAHAPTLTPYQLIATAMIGVTHSIGNQSDYRAEVSEFFGGNCSDCC